MHQVCPITGPVTSEQQPCAVTSVCIIVAFVRCLLHTLKFRKTRPFTTVTELIDKCKVHEGQSTTCIVL